MRAMAQLTYSVAIYRSTSNVMNSPDFQAHTDGDDDEKRTRLLVSLSGVGTLLIAQADSILGLVDQRVAAAPECRTGT